NITVASTHDNMLFFTNRGRMYRLKGYQIPEASRQAKGSAIVNLLPVEKDEKVTAMIALREFEDDKYLLMCTRGGVIKKTAVTDYDTSRKGGIIGIVLDEGDELIKVELTNGENEVVIGTNTGMAIRFNEKDVRSMGRVTRGVKAITLRGEDYIIGMCLANEDTQLLAVTENGYGKRTELSEYRVQNRGGIGIKTYKCSDITGNVVGIRSVKDDEDIMIITSEGIIIRIAAKDVSSIGRSTKGVRLMRLSEGVKVVSIGITEHEEPEEETEEVTPENTAAEAPEEEKTE
ncbi:MAG: DNA gyrase subunit A, partial [Clostridia bacterium]|nr:DNA gyrase subunit A [Clostridia bacterium]